MQERQWTRVYDPATAITDEEAGGLALWRFGEPSGPFLEALVESGGLIVRVESASGSHDSDERLDPAQYLPLLAEQEGFLIS